MMLQATWPEEKADEALYRQMGGASYSQALVLMDLQPPQYLLKGQHSKT